MTNGRRNRFEPITIEFMRSKATPDASGCWQWSAALSRSGYGVVSVGGKMKRAHRVMYALANGAEPPPEMLVCHRCDNPRCINPAHLFLGTQSDNMADRHAKGRARYSTELSHDDVRAIRHDSRPLGQIARQYGLSPGHISAVRAGRQRADVPDEDPGMRSADLKREVEQMLGVVA